MAQIKYTYGSQEPVTKADGFVLETAGKLMNGNLKGEVVNLNLQTKTVSYTSDGTDTITPDAGYDGIGRVEVTVQAGTSGVDNQSITINPTESTITRTIGELDPGKTGYGPVTVSAITNTYVGSAVPRQSTANVQKTITVKTGDLDNVIATVTIPAGYYETTLTVSQEIDVLPSPTTPAATAAYILAGYHAFDGEGVELEGTMPNSGGNDLSIPSSDADGNITIPAGYYNGEGEVQTAAGTVKSGLATVADPSFVTDHFEQTVNVAVPSVETAGWVSSSKGIKQANSGSTKSLDMVGVGVTASKTSLALNPTMSKVAPGTTAIDAASGSGSASVPTSAVPYVAVNMAAASDSSSVTGKVSTAGYGTTDHFTADTATSVSASVSSKTWYVPVKTASIGNPTASNSIGAPTAVTGTASTVSVPSGATIVRWVATATPSYTQATAGYVTDTTAHTGSSATARLDIPVFQLS